MTTTEQALQQFGAGVEFVEVRRRKRPHTIHALLRDNAGHCELLGTGLTQEAALFDAIARAERIAEARYARHQLNEFLSVGRVK